MLKVGSLILLVIICGWFVTLPITQITCMDETEVCPQEVTQALISQDDQRLFLTDAEARVPELLAAQPSFQLQQVSRRYPGELTVWLRRVAPEYYLVSADGQMSLLIDAQGQQVISDHPLSLPRVISPFLPTDKQPVDANYHAWIRNVVQTLSSQQQAYEYLTVISADMLLVEIRDSLVGIIGREHPVLDAERLSVVVKGLDPVKLNETQEIDARFTLPVLRTMRTVPRHNSI